MILPLSLSDHLGSGSGRLFPVRASRDFLTQPPVSLGGQMMVTGLPCTCFHIVAGYTGGVEWAALVICSPELNFISFNLQGNQSSVLLCDKLGCRNLAGHSRTSDSSGQVQQISFPSMCENLYLVTDDQHLRSHIERTEVTCLSKVAAEILQGSNL